MIVARSIGNQKHYQANAVSPLFSELRNIVLKTVGLAELLGDALKPLVSGIQAGVRVRVSRQGDRPSLDRHRPDFDPRCGSGGMFVQSYLFTKSSHHVRRPGEQELHLPALPDEPVHPRSLRTSDVYY